MKQICWWQMEAKTCHLQLNHRICWWQNRHTSQFKSAKSTKSALDTGSGPSAHTHTGAATDGPWGFMAGPGMRSGLLKFFVWLDYGCGTWLVGGFKHDVYLPFHIWDNPSHWLSYFSRLLKPPTTWKWWRMIPPDQPMLGFLRGDYDDQLADRLFNQDPYGIYPSKYDMRGTSIFLLTMVTKCYKAGVFFPTKLYRS